MDDLQGKADILSHVLAILKKHEDRITVLEGEGGVPMSGVPLKNMFGVNAYAWNFTQDPKNVNITDRIFESNYEQIKSFSGVRHYVDWMFIEDSPGEYTFSPTRRGSWDWDLILKRCFEDGIESLFCLKEPPDWLFKTWPSPHDASNIPATYGVDLENPLAYIAQAKAAYQVAGRYGSNKDVTGLTVNTTPRWTADPVNEVKAGLGYLKYIECDNERDRNWLEDYRGMQTGRQYAAHMSAFYDGHQGKLGAGVGVKIADPNMMAVMGGLALANPDYAEDMIEWCNEFRGGSLPFDVINYHHYSNDSQDSGQWGYATRGVAPELRNLASVADQFVALGKRLGLPVWVTETGYDVLKTPQSANPIGDKSAEQVQSDWLIRTSLLYARHGVERVFFYQLFDDNAGSGVQYSSSGLAHRLVMDAIKMFTKELGDYSYLETINESPVVDVYVKGVDKAYVCFFATETGHEADYILNGKTIRVTETPIIVK